MDTNEVGRLHLLDRARLEAVVDALDVVIFTTSPEGEITWWSPSAERHYGFAADQVIGTQILNLAAAPGDRDREPALVAAIARGRNVPAHRIQQIRADGTAFECLRSLTPVGEPDGYHTEIAILCQPLDDPISHATEAHEPHPPEADPHEAASREPDSNKTSSDEAGSQEADSAGRTYRWRAYGDDAASVAHDINNVLGAIMNYAEFVSDDLGVARSTGTPADWDRLERDVRRIRATAERASALSRQLLDFDHQREHEPRSNDLNELVDGAATLLTGVAGESVHVDTSGLEPDLWHTSVDVGQAERVLVNLVLNATQAMPAGGTLKIVTSNVTLDQPPPPAPGLIGPAEPGRYVCASIEDSGTGMTDEVIAHAFEPTFTTKPRGTGLGLATVARIVAEARGHVRIESELGVGTTVSVLVPATPDRTVR